jgi:ABC-type nitrate/sulfonate/bicarbonate transport system ATPase subunit
MPGAAELEVHIVAKRVTAPDGTDRILLRELHLTAAAGEIIALLGPSGAGKTTTLRIALGLDRQFEGRVRAPDGRVGAVFQEPTLLPWLSVADNLRLAMPGASDARIAELLTLCELGEIAGYLPSELSLGMARRVALARALSVDPALLVLDEPFVSLDPRLGAALARRIATYTRRSGCIVLLASHDLEHALAVADRICVLAGHPTTLAADIAVPSALPGQDTAKAIEALRVALAGQFAFLARSDGEARPGVSSSGGFG